MQNDEKASTAWMQNDEKASTAWMQNDENASTAWMPWRPVRCRHCAYSTGPYMDGGREYMLCHLYEYFHRGYASSIEPDAWCTLAERRHA